MQRALIIFARAPQRGMVKTRLAASLGDDEALRIYRELGMLVVAESANGEWTRNVAYTPDDAEPDMRTWLGEELRYVPQGEGDLGERMARAIRAELDGGAQRVVIIGTDCPELTLGDIQDAFAALDDAELAIGPATDGGYYLIGVRADHPVLFTDMMWSAPSTLAVTLERAARAGLRVRMLAPRSDIDTIDDLRAWHARIGAGPGA